ncbi:UNVERIFIED_ORG: hypothetical protein J2W75_003707 [Methylorubrum zatmanii]
MHQHKASVSLWIDVQNDTRADQARTGLVLRPSASSTVPSPSR